MDAKTLMPIALALLGLIGFNALQQGQKNQQDNVSNLPALQAQVANLQNLLDSERNERANGNTAVRNEINGLRRDLQQVQADVAGALDSDSLDARFTAVQAAQEALEQQLSRRISLEIKDPIYRDMDQLEQRLLQFDTQIHNELNWLRDYAINHINNPPNSHSNPH